MIDIFGRFQVQYMHALHVSVSLLIFTCLIGCSQGIATEGEEASTPEAGTAPAPQLIVQYPSGQRALVENISEIDEALTFRMVLPENLPLGLKLRTLNASLPESKSNDPIRSNFQLQSDVLLSFASDDRAVGIQLYENIALTKIASPNSKNLYVEDTTVTVLVDTERDSVSAAWEACAIGLVLTGGPTAQLTEANLVLIVKATLMAC